MNGGPAAAGPGAKPAADTSAKRAMDTGALPSVISGPDVGTGVVSIAATQLFIRTHSRRARRRWYDWYAAGFVVVIAVAYLAGPGGRTSQSADGSPSGGGASRYGICPGYPRGKRTARARLPARPGRSLSA